MNSAFLEFKNTVWNYYKTNQRSFPWRETHDPYKILVSELMLQQTQTDRVIPKYNIFLDQFPTIKTLADSPQRTILKLWQGLGYNKRALYLHETARILHTKYKGLLPKDIKTLQTFPGIGPYTASAIMAFAYNQPTILIETNIRTVFLYHFYNDAEKKQVHDKSILPLIEQTIDHNNPRDWYYALMDYGVYLKKLHPNPSQKSQHYTKQSKFLGSDRQIRGQILKLLLKDDVNHVSTIQQQTNTPRERIHKIITTLERDGFIVRDRGTIRLA